MAQIPNVTALDTVTYYLSTFKELLDSFPDRDRDNIIIGGMSALALHGLEIGRKIDDLDIIIYNPTERQITALTAMKPFQVKKSLVLGYGDVQRSYKFQKNQLYLDILIEVGVPKPKDLLLVKVNNILYEVQSIKNVIDAKRSYQTNRTSDSGGEIGSQQYVRDKDVRDFLTLKNLNFNL